MTSTTKPNTNGTPTMTACAQTAGEAFKTGVEANQKMFSNVTNMFAKGFNPEAFTNPMAMMGQMGNFGTMPAMFEKMTKAMNSMVDSNARLATECNTLMIDAMRSNARVIERTGDMVVGQMTGKSAKPAAETCREICDEAMTFTTKAGERMTKMNTEHAQRVAQVMDEATICKTACNA